jgi:hypothetical protein
VNGKLYPAQKSVAPTAAIEYGLLPTPTASNACNGNGYQRDRNGHITPTLTGAIGIAMLPTPTARDWKDGSGAQVSKARSENLNDRIAYQGKGKKLNPVFVEMMMGYPPDWTDIS